MTDPDGKVSDHYTVSGLERRILDALENAGKDVGALTFEDLAPVDAFHIRGRVATEELAALAGLQSGHSVLDVGCGVGGTSRYLAATFGCNVVGVDLTEEYCRVAESLSERVGLADSTRFRQGSALDLPFDDATFDVAWTEHVQMNIEDKARFYGEMVRVLKPGGQLVFHDIFAGDGGAPHFPVPWAGDPSISHLAAVDDVRALFAGPDVETSIWKDRTVESKAFFRSLMQRVGSEGWMPVGLHLLMGDDATAKFSNVLRSLEENRLTVAQAVIRKAAG